MVERSTFSKEKEKEPSKSKKHTNRKPFPLKNKISQPIDLSPNLTNSSKRNNIFRFSHDVEIKLFDFNIVRII